ncbi:hypothetical protein D3C87_1808650 [compost metagenome]
MPTASAASGSSATARNDKPIRVLLNSSDSANTSNAAVTAAKISNCDSSMPPSSSGSSLMPNSRPCT